MAEMIIMLRRDPNSGKNHILIKLDSDPDALPIEHEQMHKALAEKVLGRKLDDKDEIIVERESEAQPAGPVQQPNEPQKQKQGNKGS